MVQSKGQSPSALRIDGDASLTHLNQALKTQLEPQGQPQGQPKLQISLSDNGSAAAIESLVANRIDLAAIGRPLTAAEQQQGLVALPIGSQKVAVFVSRQNPFTGSLTNQQFAQVLNGGITNWSQIGGPNQPLRLIDHPQTSDTRQALERYPVLGMAWSATANSSPIAGSLGQVSPEALQQLGPDGISYRIADQVLSNPNLRVIALHSVGPQDARYSFSQPLFYVYKGPQPSAAVQAFLTELRQPNLLNALVDPALGKAMTVNTAAIQAATAGAAAGAVTGNSVTAPPPKAAASTSSATIPELQPGPIGPQLNAPAGPAAVSRTIASPSNQSDWQFPWAWLVWLLPLLGLPLLAAWLMRLGRSAASPVAPVNEPIDLNALKPLSISRTRLVVVPRDCRMAYAYWELSDEVKQHFKVHPNDRLALRLYDRSPDSGLQPDAYQQFESLGTDCDRLIPIPKDDRRYRIELGYVGLDRVWQKLATAEQIHVPACSIAPSLSNGTMAERSTAFGLNGSSLAGLAGAGLAGAGLAGAGLAGSLAQAKSNQDESIQVKPNLVEVNLAQPNLAETSLTDQPLTDQAWADQTLADQPLANLVQPPPDRETLLRQSTISPSSTQQAQAFAWRLASLERRRSWVTIEPQADQSALVRWQIDPDEQDQMAIKGAKQLALRVCDITALDIDRETPHRCLFHRCNPEDRSTRISLSDRHCDYVAELGYITQDGRWLSLAQSDRLPAQVDPSPLSDQSPDSAPISATQTAVAIATANVAASDRARQDVNSRIRLMACLPNQVHEADRDRPYAYAYWDLSATHKQHLRNQGGLYLVLRIYDANQINLDYQPPHSVIELICDDDARDRIVEVPLGDRDYVAELGYLTTDHRFLSLGRSLHAHIPRTVMANSETPMN
jgi:phosphate transport system substrate-binding protein